MIHKAGLWAALVVLPAMALGCSSGDDASTPSDVNEAADTAQPDAPDLLAPDTAWDDIQVDKADVVDVIGDVGGDANDGDLADSPDIDDGDLADSPDIDDGDLADSPDVDVLAPSAAMVTGQMVSSAGLSTSPKYRLIGAVGSPLSQATPATSPNYRLTTVLQPSEEPAP